jgi:hypothetical protein
MPGQSKDTHVLRELELPARYEALADRVGPEVAQLLVDPGGVTRSTLERAGLSVRGRREGARLPLVADPVPARRRWRAICRRFCRTSTPRPWHTTGTSISTRCSTLLGRARRHAMTTG